MRQRNIQTLKEKGPATGNELPAFVTVDDRIRGLSAFKPTPAGRTVKCVYYLHTEHTAQEVVEAWFEANAEHIDNLSVDAIRKAVHSCGSDFGQALSNSDLKGSRDPDSTWTR